jgi:hypothetical protein
LTHSLHKYKLLKKPRGVGKWIIPAAPATVSGDAFPDTPLVFKNREGMDKVADPVARIPIPLGNTVNAFGGKATRNYLK